MKFKAAMLFTVIAVAFLGFAMAQEPTIFFSEKLNASENSSTNRPNIYIVINLGGNISQQPLAISSNNAIRNIQVASGDNIAKKVNVTIIDAKNTEYDVYVDDFYKGADGVEPEDMSPADGRFNFTVNGDMKHRITLVKKDAPSTFNFLRDTTMFFAAGDDYMLKFGK